MKASTITAAQLEWVKPPLQARSQLTLERLLEAAEAIVVESGIDAVTISKVARRAGSSVGAFYARFADKDALVRCLFERFCEQAMATSEAVLEPSRWEGSELEEALEAMIAFMLRVLSERRLLILALIQRAAYEPELSALVKRLHRRITDCLISMLDASGIEMRHPRPATALDMGVWLVLSLMESRVLHGPHVEPPVADEDASREVARMMARYLGVERREDRKRSQRLGVET